MEDTKALEVYVLRQSTPNSQSLTSIKDTVPSYTIQSKETGGFMNKKPHMVVAKQQDGMKYDCAEVRFDSYSSATTILYKGSGISQELGLASSLDQRYECLIEGVIHWWQPVGSSRRELELTNAAGKRIALFVYANEVAFTTGARTGNNRKNVKSEIIGELHILQDFVGGTLVSEQLLCTGLAVIERAKRRAANIGKPGSAYKQGAACGITTNVYGGGL